MTMKRRKPNNQIFKSLLNKEDCAEAARLLLCSFPWSESKEGHKFWAVVHEKLENYSKE